MAAFLLFNRAMNKPAGETSPTSTPKQPDRLIKLACPECGSVARVSNLTLRVSRGILCATDKVAFVPAPRRVYTPREAVA